MVLPHHLHPQSHLLVPQPKSSSPNPNLHLLTQISHAVRVCGLVAHWGHWDPGGVVEEQVLPPPLALCSRGFQLEIRGVRDKSRLCW